MKPNGKNTTYWWDMGQECMRKDDYDKAGECFKKVIEIDPNDEEAYHILGQVYAQRGDTKKAIECFLETIKINPEHEGANFRLGLNYAILGDMEKSMEYYGKCKEDWY